MGGGPGRKGGGGEGKPSPQTCSNHASKGRRIIPRRELKPETHFWMPPVGWRRFFFANVGLICAFLRECPFKGVTLF